MIKEYKPSIPVRNILYEILFYVVVTIVLFFLFGYIELFETLHQISRHYEYLELDEIFNLVPVFLLVLTLYAFRRHYEILFLREKEQENMEQLLLFKQIIDASPEAIFVVDRHNCKIINIDEKAPLHSGYSQDELLDMHIYDIFCNFEGPEDTKAKVHALNALAGNAIYEDQLRCKDGSCFPIEASIGTYESPDNKYCIFIVRDITERKRLEQEKTEQEKMLLAQSRMAAMGEMLGNIAHQWRQPITVIGLSVQNIEDAYDTSELDQDYLRKQTSNILKHIQYMSKTIDDFRHFYKPNQKKQSICITEVVDNALDLTRETFQNQGITVNFQASCTCHTETYTNELVQVVLVIMQNAKDALLEKQIQSPHIDIRFKRVETSCILEIEDNAGGINPSVMDKIFDPYFSTKGADIGTGVGLYMVKTIVEKQMKGVLSVSNTDQGACFKIELKDTAQ